MRLRFSRRGCEPVQVVVGVGSRFGSSLRFTCLGAFSLLRAFSFACMIQQS